jgi:hypothetical protein
VIPLGGATPDDWTTTKLYVRAMYWEIGPSVSKKTGMRMAGEMMDVGWKAVGDG